jgi:hypothetical protein
MLIGVVRLEAESLSLLTAQRVRSVRPDVEPHEEQMRAVADQPPDIACLRRKLSEVSCSAPAAVLSPVAGPAAAPQRPLVRSVRWGMVAKLPVHRRDTLTAHWAKRSSSGVRTGMDPDPTG